jgi:hypothetical protein
MVHVPVIEESADCPAHLTASEQALIQDIECLEAYFSSIEVVADEDSVDHHVLFGSCPGKSFLSIHLHPLMGLSTLLWSITVIRVWGLPTISELSTPLQSRHAIMVIMQVGTFMSLFRYVKRNCFELNNEYISTQPLSTPFLLTRNHCVILWFA